MTRPKPPITHRAKEVSQAGDRRPRRDPNPIRVLIVDDEPMARGHIQTLLQRERPDWIVEQSGNGGEALRKVNRLRPDLIFLDIQMPDMDGFEVLSEIDPNDLPQVVFVTAFEQYAIRAFEAHALDYLLKPYDDDRFLDALTRAESQILNRRKPAMDAQALLDLVADLSGKPTYLRRLTVRISNRTVFIQVHEIDHLKAEGCYVRIHVGDASYLIRDSLGRLESRLDPGSFTRIHRSSLVRIDAIQAVLHKSRNETVVVLKNGRKLPVSRSYRQHLKSL